MMVGCGEPADPTAQPRVNTCPASRVKVTHHARPRNQDSLPHPKNYTQKHRCTRAHRNGANIQHRTLKNTVPTSPLAHALSQEQAARAAKSCQQLPECAVSCVVWRYKLSHKDQRSDSQQGPAQPKVCTAQDHATTAACSCRTGLLLLVAAPASTSLSYHTIPG